MRRPVPDGPLQEILERAARLPDVDHFPGVDEINAFFTDLTAKHPDLVTARRIGTSRLGDPLTMYSIGTGPDNALVYAGVHPNEPIGFWTAMRLAEDLCADERFRTGCRWHIIGCIDPDGTRLNEGWFRGPWDRVAYAEQFYRPAPGEQVEWSFPFQHKDGYFDAVMPEAFALMRVIDELAPTIAVSLHNTELGGVYYYLSRELDGMVGDLHAIARYFELPLDRGEPESPVAKVLGPAVFGMISATENYDYVESLGMQPYNGSGGSSSEYAARHGTVSLVAELPYWTHPGIEDESSTDLPYADAVASHAEELGTDMAALLEIFEAGRPYLSDDSQLVRATAEFLPFLAHIPVRDKLRAAELDRARLATVAEVHGLADRNRSFRLRYGGMLRRAIAGEIARGSAHAALHPLAARLDLLYREWQAEAAAFEEGVARVPISKLVGVQYAATLALLAAVRREQNR